MAIHLLVSGRSALTTSRREKTKLAEVIVLVAFMMYSFDSKHGWAGSKEDQPAAQGFSALALDS